MFLKILLSMSLMFFLNTGITYADDCAGQTCTIPITLNLTPNHTSESFELAANPTTGYVWEASAYDTKWIAVTHEYKSECKEKMVGCGGRDIWTAMAKPEAFVNAPHSILVTLVYHRPWEHNVPPTEEKKVLITINK